MGNAQGGGGRRERMDSSSRHSRSYTGEDECPVQVKIPKGEGDGASSATLQYVNASEFPVVLKWAKATTSTKQVYVSGSWDGWKKRIPLVRSHDDFTVILNLPEGDHQYKYNVDGNWCLDQTSPKVDNGQGGQNNQLKIEKQDFEVFEALDKDLSDTTATAEAKGTPDIFEKERELGKNKPFTQEIPDRRDFEKAPHPPILPPHLLQVILNKDTPVSCDPNVLPEPNHVMLNHLYALSIKDGVMVLSATHRFRKKYVTTLLYRPIAS